MISICNILPSNCVNEQMPRQKYELYLTHKILENPKKYAFLAKEKGVSYKILDNSACELGEGMDFAKVLEAAEIIGADEVVLPDLPRKGNSLAYSLKYLIDIPSTCKYKLAAVVQGETEEEILACAEQILQLRRINTIMIPKWYCQLNSSNGLGRHILTKKIMVMMDMLQVRKEIHWLGLDTGIRELVTPLAKVVRSVDTGLFAAYSTPQWERMNICSERPRELKIDLEQMDVDMDKWSKFLQQQKQIIGEM